MQHRTAFSKSKTAVQAERIVYQNLTFLVVYYEFLEAFDGVIEAGHNRGSAAQRMMLLVHTGELLEPAADHGTLLHFSDTTELQLQAGDEDFGALVFYGTPINESIAHIVI